MKMKEKTPKQPKRGLAAERGLRVVKTAGFKAKTAKKDKSVNKKAGLHDKKKNLSSGEKRIYKRKPLGLTKVRRMRQFAVALSAAVILVVAYFGLGFIFKPNFICVEDLGNNTVCAVKADGKEARSGVYYFPEDGSLPTEHTLIENVAYMNYVLKNRPYWSSYMHSHVSTVMDQDVYTHKRSYEGNLISADMPQGASSIARQFCYTDTDVKWREKDRNKAYDSMDSVDWSNAKPYGLPISDFRSLRGLPANDFSVYILDELTVKNANDYTVVDNGDGTYSMTLDLRVHQSGLDSAVHYYKQQMYVTGGLYAWPTFDYTYVTYTFTKDWVIQSFAIRDSYTAKMGTILSDCTSESVTDFSYRLEDAQNTYYKDYFYQNYITWNPTSVATTPDAATCLASAFGGVLDEGANLKIDMELDGKPVDGSVYFTLKDGALSDLRVALGSIKVYIDEQNGKSAIFAALGGNKFKIDAEALLGSSEAQPSTQAEGGESAEDGESILDLNALLSQLFDGEFEINRVGKSKKNYYATLNSRLSLFGLDIPIEFAFDIQGENITLDYLKTEFDLGKTHFKANLTFGTEEDIPAKLTSSQKAEYRDLMNEGIALDMGLKLDGLSLDGTVFVALGNGIFGGVSAKFGDITAYYQADGTLYFADGSGAKYKLNTGDIGAAETQGAFEGFENLDVAEIITDIISNLSIGGGKLSTNTTLNLLQPAIKLALAVNINDGLSADFNAELFGKQVEISVKLAENSVPELKDKESYVDILNEGITVDLKLALDGLAVDGTVSVVFDGGNFKEVRAKFGDITVYYADNTVYFADGSGAQYKVDISGISGTQSLAAFDEIDLNGLISKIIENISFKENTIALENFDITEDLALNLALGLQGGIKASVSTTLFNKEISAEVKLGKTNLPELKNKGSYVDILNEGVCLDLNLQIDGVKLDGCLFVEMQNGQFAGIRVNIKNSDIAVRYESGDSALYISGGDDLNIKLPLSAFGTETVAEDGGQTFDLNGLLNEVLENLTAGKDGVSTSFKLNLTLGGETLEIPAYIGVNVQDGINVSANLSAFGKDIEICAGFGNAENAPALEDAQKAEFIDVLNDGFSVAGSMNFNAGGTEIGLTVNKLSMSFNGGVCFALDANLVIGGMDNNIYAAYNGATGDLTVTYGVPDEDGIGATGLTINTLNGDLKDLENALVAVYNRVIEVLDGVLEDRTLAAAGSLDDIVSQIKGLLSALNIGSSAAVGIDDLTGGESGFNISDILGAISINSVDGGTSITYGDSIAILLGLKDSKIDLGFEYANESSSITLYANAHSFGAYEEIECPVAQDNLITAAQLCDAVDYLAATFAMLTERNLSLEVNGKVETNSGDIKYEVSANLEYDRGAKDGMPVHIALGSKQEGENRTGLNFWLNSDMYAHLNITLASKMPKVNSLAVDMYLTDIVPLSSNGKTTGIEYNEDGTPATDGTLDLFFMLSKFAPGESGYQPLAVYVPVSEITNIGAMAAAMLNLGGVSFEGEEYQTINEVIAELANALDSLLISNLAPGLGVQLASLGESLLPNILGKTIQQIIGDLIGTGKTESIDDTESTGDAEKIDDAESTGETPVQPEQQIREGNYVKFLAINRAEVGGVDTGSVRIIFNSSAIYGGNVRSDIEFTADKTYNEDGISRIRNWGMHNVYINGALTEMLSLDMSAQYSVTKNYDKLSGYYDFRGVDTLLQSIVNSATHESARATERELAALNAQGIEVPEYLLNHYYFIDGNIDIELSVISIININFNINIQSISVTIDEYTNNVLVNARLSYGGLKKMGIVAIEGDTSVDLTIDIMGGMLYIKRTQTTQLTAFGEKNVNEVIYRVMPLSGFTDTKYLMDNICFLFNFASIIKDNIINLDITGGNGLDGYANYDYGKTLSNILKSFVFTETEDTANWAITVNGQILTDLIGFEMSDLTITLNAQKLDNAYIIRNLEISQTSMKFVSGISMKFGGKLNYRNSQLIMEEGAQDVSKDNNLATAELPMFGGYSFAQILGGTSFEEIQNRTAWSSLLAENGGKSYLELSAGSNLKVGTLNFEHESLDGSYDSFGVDGVFVLYNGATGSVYTLHGTPSLDGLPQKEGFVAVWENSYRLSESGVILRAVYGNVYDIAVNYGYEVNGVTSQTFCNVYQQVLLPKDVMVEIDGEYYGLTGYICNETGEKIDAQTHLTAYNEQGQPCLLIGGIDSNYTFNAEWERMYAVTFESTYDGKTVSTVKYYYENIELNVGNIPEVPAYTGVNGSWMLEEGTKVTQNFTVYAKYEVNVYEVKIFSSQSVKDGAYVWVNGEKVYLEWQSADGGFEAVLSLKHGSLVTLYTDIACADGTYNFTKYQLAGDGTFAAVEQFTATAEGTYEIVWESKAVSVKYMSDVQFEGGAADGEYFTQSASTRYGRGEQFTAVQATDGSLLLLGWFAELQDGSYVYVSSIDQTAKLFALNSGDTIEVTVWAVWAERVEVTEISSSFSWFTLKVSGSYSGGGLATEKSLAIAQNAGLSYSVTAALCKSDDGANIGEAWSASPINGNSFNLSHSTTGAKYGGATVTVTYTVNGEAVASQSVTAFKKT